MKKLLLLTLVMTSVTAFAESYRLIDSSVEPRVFGTDAYGFECKSDILITQSGNRIVVSDINEKRQWINFNKIGEGRQCARVYSSSIGGWQCTTASKEASNAFAVETCNTDFIFKCNSADTKYALKALKDGVEITFTSRDKLYAAKKAVCRYQQI